MDCWIETREPLRGRVVFWTGYMGFEGHFSDRRILPGFLHVEAALEVMRKAGFGSRLVEVRDAKFLGVILPEVVVGVEVEREGDLGWVRVVMSLEDGEVVSRFSLRAE